MSTRRLLHVVIALAVLAPVACATAAQRERAQRMAPANAPGGVFAAGTWSAELVGAPPQLEYPSARMVRAMPFEVQVTPVRDSAAVTFLFGEQSVSFVVGAASAHPQRSQTSGPGRMIRTRPQRLAIVEDAIMTFTLPSAIGWKNLRCELRLTGAGTWDGPCLAEDGFRALSLSLGLRSAKTASRN
jgi:hypothetical protein